MSHETLTDQYAEWEREWATCNRPWREHAIKALREGGDMYADYIGFERWMGEQTERMASNELFGVWDGLPMFERIGLYGLLCGACDFASTEAHDA